MIANLKELLFFLPQQARQFFLPFIAKLICLLYLPSTLVCSSKADQQARLGEGVDIVQQILAKLYTLLRTSSISRALR